MNGKAIDSRILREMVLHVEGRGILHCKYKRRIGLGNVLWKGAV